VRYGVLVGWRPPRSGIVLARHTPAARTAPRSGSVNAKSMRPIARRSYRRLSVANRARDWMSQVVRDLEQAQDSRHAGRHEWACFAAHKGRVLDTFYIPPRCPNSHPEGAPFEHYGPLQSDEAISYARESVEFSRSQMA
jgi:hypothetical protein